MKCNQTCHKNCVFEDNEEKRSCCVIDHKTGKCKRCVKNCDWTFHKNLPYIFEYYEEEENKNIWKYKKRICSKFK